MSSKRHSSAVSTRVSREARIRIKIAANYLEAVVVVINGQTTDVVTKIINELCVRHNRIVIP